MSCEYIIQVELEEIDEDEWEDLNPDFWSQPCHAEGFKILQDKIDELQKTQDRNYRIICRKVTIEEDVFYRSNSRLR